MRNGQNSVKIIYSDRYDLNLGDHVFPSVKYKLAHDKLIADGVARPEEFVEPEPAADEDVALVHTRDYIHKLKTRTLSYAELLQLEIPYSPELIRAVWLAAGGSIRAARQALDDGVAINLGGGFHHACSDHGEGFCVIHDVAIAIRRLQKDGAIRTALTVDCDVHQGNGTAEIFAGDSSVFTFSMHQENNYPFYKPPSSLDINLADGVEDSEYLAALEDGLQQSFAAMKPDLLLYLAGADPYREDQLGGLKLSLQGLEFRDRMVFEAARQHNVPVAVTLAGGYARHLPDTVRIHSNTARIAKEFTATK
ncbi:MAG TPA: histone deacetylase [Terriglobia bacterium]|nr:histone deacetylase [Terriglobia bacterium]